MKRLFALSLTLLLGASLLALPAAAAETGEEPVPVPPGPVVVEGAATWMDGDTLLVNPGETDDLSRAVVVHLGDAPIVDAASGGPAAETVKDGDTVRAWVGPAMMLSLPPQATALLVLTGLPEENAPAYCQVDRVSAGEDGSGVLTAVTFTATDGTELTVTDKAALTPYLTRNLVTLADIVPGAELLVWRDDEGAAEKVIVFPYAYRGYAAVDKENTVSVNGETVTPAARVTADGDVLLPVRAVAEALGMEVHWDKARGAVVSYGEDMVKPAPAVTNVLMTALPGGTICRVAADGSAEEVYGVCVKENGVTYISRTALAQALGLYLAG